MRGQIYEIVSKRTKLLAEGKPVDDLDSEIKKFIENTEKKIESSQVLIDKNTEIFEIYAIG